MSTVKCKPGLRPRLEPNLSSVHTQICLMWEVERYVQAATREESRAARFLEQDWRSRQIRVQKKDLLERLPV